MILIVDEDEPTRRIMQRLITRHGYTVRTASSGEEALELIRQKKPQLILLDTHLPGMSGVKLLGMLRLDGSTADLPILLHTASMIPVDELEAVKLGASGLLRKGMFDSTMLLGRIDSCLRPQSRSAQDPPPTDLRSV